MKPKRARANRPGRNQPCPCGSGRKYKKCHGTHLNRYSRTKNLSAELETHAASEELRKHVQGQGKPIISTEFQGHRVVAVGNTVYFGKNHKTFVDFLSDYIRRVLGPDWGTAEIKKRLEDRHPILQWYDALCAHQKVHASRPAGEVQSFPSIGLVQAYYGLAYNLYLLKHNADLQEHLVRRLKDKNLFYPAYYETYVAAWFILSGFSLAIEDERDSTRTHPEFLASRGDRCYFVEAKTRTPNKPHLDVGNQLYRALCKESQYPRFVFVDTNISGQIDSDNYATQVTNAIRNRETKLTIRGEPAPSAYVFVTNQAYHLQLDDDRVPRVLLALGFKIPTFGHDASFSSFIDAYRAEEEHADAIAVQEGFKKYAVPETFDGELSNFAFGEAKRRFIIGQRYQISKDVFATLTDALVFEAESEAFLCFSTENDDSYVFSVRLSESELAAYKAQPETFFGRIRKPQGKFNNPYELFKFFVDSYRDTPIERLLELMNDANDIKDLEKLSVEDLRLTYAQRLTYAATRLP